MLELDTASQRHHATGVLERTTRRDLRDVVPVCRPHRGQPDHLRHPHLSGVPPARPDRTARRGRGDGRVGATGHVRGSAEPSRRFAGSHYQHRHGRHDERD